MRLSSGPSRALATLAAAATLTTACDRSAADDSIEATGTIEVAEADVSPLAAARVVRIRVEEGDAVRAGDTLVELSRPDLPSDIVQREARLSAARARLRDLEAGARPADLRRQEAELRSAEAEAQRAGRDAERYAALFEGGGISRQEYDRARTAAATAEARRDAIAGSLRLLREGTRPDQIAAARAEVASASAAVAAAESTAADLVLVSPVAGRVLERHVEPGEVLAPGTPAVTIGETDRPWARVFVNAPHVPHLAPGQRVSARLDGSTREFEGRIAAIDPRAQFTPRIALTEDERADLMFGVRIAFADTTGILRPGLPVTVRMRRDPGPGPDSP